MAKRKKKTVAAPEPPTCHCLVICDDVLESKAKQKLTLVGVIDGVLAMNFPAAVGNFVVYARLSNIYGDQEVSLEIARADDPAKRLRCGARLRSQDPLGVATIITTVPAFVVDRPGRFWLNLWHGSNLIQQTAFQVVGLSDQPED